MRRVLEQPESLEPLAGAADAAGKKPKFAELLDTFNGAWFKGLQNGLGEPENRRLMRSDDVDEIVGLVVQGLRRISAR